jgi:hypothetical protein
VKIAFATVSGVLSKWPLILHILRMRLWNSKCICYCCQKPQVPRSCPSALVDGFLNKPMKE